MLRHALLLTMLFVPAAPLPEDTRSDQEKIRGEWKLVKMEVSNQRTSLVGNVVEIKGDEWGQRTPLNPVKFKLDPSKSPKHIEFMVPSPSGITVFLGIYEFVGDRLRI